MFGSRRTEAALAALQAENSDLRLQLRTERAQFAEERQNLLDRLLALTEPGALREVRRAPSPGPVPTPSPEHARRRRLNYPSSAAPSVRPPDPATPPTPGTRPLTDSQVQSVLQAAQESN